MNTKPKRKWQKPELKSLTIGYPPQCNPGWTRSDVCIASGNPTGTVACQPNSKNVVFS